MSFLVVSFTGGNDKKIWQIVPSNSVIITLMDGVYVLSTGSVGEGIPLDTIETFDTITEATNRLTKIKETQL